MQSWMYTVRELELTACMMGLELCWIEVEVSHGTWTVVHRPVDETTMNWNMLVLMGLYKV